MNRRLAQRLLASSLATLTTLVALAALPAQAQSAPGQLDPRLFGRWVHQSMLTSRGGVGDAAFATEWQVEFGADGRVQQWVRSAGGGSQWSARGDRRLDFSGQWQVRGPEVWVRADGEARFERATAYRIAGEYLVTEGGNGRRIWQR